MSTIEILIFLAVLFVIARVLNIFDFKGTVAALLVGIIISFLGSVRWLVLLLIFAVFAYMATKAFFSQKQQRRLQEGVSGERRVSNVLYAGMMGLVIAAFNIKNVSGYLPNYHYFELFDISLAVVSSDTFASEIGMIDSRVYLITNLKKTVPGINGGISPTGLISALGGATIVGVSYGLLSVNGFQVLQVIVVTVLGFVGCQVDSILGALFENKGKLSKGEVNFLASLSGVILGIVYIILS